MTRRATRRTTSQAGVACLACAAIAPGIASASTEPTTSITPFVMTLDDDAGSALFLDWPDRRDHFNAPAPSTMDATSKGLPELTPGPFADAPVVHQTLTDPTPSALRLAWTVTDDIRLGATGRKRAMDPDLHYFALSAEAQLTGMNNAGLFIGYDVYRDWLPDELPETDLAREGVFVEFRMSF